MSEQNKSTSSEPAFPLSLLNEDENSLRDVLRIANTEIEASLKRIIRSYFQYYERSLTHLTLEKDAPASRAIQPPELGVVVELPQVGGLHHRYERRAA